MSSRDRVSDIAGLDRGPLRVGIPADR